MNTTDYTQDKGKGKYCLRWRDLTLKSSKPEKCLLNNLNGCVRSGQFLTIMGPSGAGKSSLLSILSARMRSNNSNLTFFGDTLLNGKPYDIEQFAEVAAYVQQDDLLFGTLTVRQIFLFQARLKLWNKSSWEQEKKCQQMLKKLNLIECGDTLVGNSQFKKCISGGQKKRVSIGVELISNPQILIFDQPTSGLDSHNSLVVMKLLSNLAKNEGKLIMATIHQPSSLMFRCMDKLYLLKNGECLFNDSADKIIPYMEELRIQVDYRMNPADFFMLQISAMKEQQGYVTPLNSQNYMKKGQLPKQHYSDGSKESSHSSITVDKSEIPYHCQIIPLFMRSLRNFYRQPSNRINKIVGGLLIPFLLGIMYFRIGSDVPDQFEQSYVNNIICFLFMGLFILYGQNFYESALVFPNEKELVFKEVGSGLYSMSIYYLSHMLAELPGCLTPALVNALIVYFAAGLELQYSHIGIFILLYLIMAIQGYFSGMMFGVLCKNDKTAIDLLPAVILPMQLFGGLFVNINNVPAYISWFQYLCPLRHAFLILFQDQMDSDKFAVFGEMDLPEKYGLGGDRRLSWIILLSWQAGYLFLSMIFLFMRKKSI